MNQIIINDQCYNNYETKISWGRFEINSRNDSEVIKREGISPFIRFNIEDNIIIGLETTYSIEMFEETKINEVVEMTKYLSDITYEVDEDWESLIYSKYTCNMIRKDNNTFEFILHVKSDEFEELSIVIDAEIIIN